MTTYDVLGIYLPQLLVNAPIAAALVFLLSRLVTPLGVYRVVWHPALFNICLFIVVLAVLSLPAGQLWIFR